MDDGRQRLHDLWRNAKVEMRWSEPHCCDRCESGWGTGRDDGESWGVIDGTYTDLGGIGRRWPALNSTLVPGSRVSIAGEAGIREES